MKCPLFLTIKVYQDNTTMERLGDCLKEECACFDQARNQCPILSIIQAMIALNSTLVEIAEKIPTYQQSQK